jgi:hypothetical protein
MQSEHRWYLFQDEQGKYAITTHARADRFNLDPICSEDYSLFFTRRGALLGGVPVIIKRSPCRSRVARRVSHLLGWRGHSGTRR